MRLPGSSCAAAEVSKGRGLDSPAVEELKAGASRKLPARKWAATSFWTRFRRPRSSAHAPTMYAARSSADAISIAAQKIVSRSRVSPTMITLLKEARLQHSASFAHDRDQR